MLAERAASEGPRPTRAPEVSPFHPATSWGERREQRGSFDGRSRDCPGCETRERARIKKVLACVKSAVSARSGG